MDGELSDGRFCIDCDCWQEWGDFKILRHGYNGRHSRCRKCDSDNAKLLYHLKKVNAMPRDQLCEYCGNYCDRLCLDHDHLSGEFRAWACTSCNLQRRSRWGAKHWKQIQNSNIT